MFTNIKNYFYDIAGLGLNSTVLFFANTSGFTMCVLALLFVMFLAIMN